MLSFYSEQLARMIQEDEEKLIALQLQQAEFDQQQQQAPPPPSVAPHASHYLRQEVNRRQSQVRLDSWIPHTVFDPLQCTII